MFYDIQSCSFSSCVYLSFCLYVQWQQGFQWNLTERKNSKLSVMFVHFEKFIGHIFNLYAANSTMATQSEAFPRITTFLYDLDLVHFVPFRNTNRVHPLVKDSMCVTFVLNTLNSFSSTMLSRLFAHFPKMTLTFDHENQKGSSFRHTGFYKPNITYYLFCTLTHISRTGTIKS